MSRKLQSRLSALFATLMALAMLTATSVVSLSDAGASTANHTYTVGLITDLTGAAASGGVSAQPGIQAGIDEVKAVDGYTIKYVLADDQSTPAGTLAAAQKLVEQDHVFAVLASSALLFAAAPYLNAHNVPVIGISEDGPEWGSDKNMFGIFGACCESPAPVTNQVGLAMKFVGVTKAGVLAYGIGGSTLAGEVDAASIKAAGIDVPYTNYTFAYGSTNVQPIALAMKSAGVDGFIAPTTAATALQTIVALKQLGVTLKGSFLYNGYGGDLSQAGPGALNDAQGVYFGTEFEPTELHTPGTEEFAKYLKEAGVKGDPTFTEFGLYLAVAELVQGLKAAGANPTPAGLINALNNKGLKSNGLGLYGNHYFKTGARGDVTAGVDNCTWLTKLKGSKFVLVPGADPICGKNTGQTVSLGS